MSDFTNAELAEFHSDYIVAGLPCPAEVCVYIRENRTFDTNSLFEGEPVLVPEGGYGTQIWLEQGVRMNILSEMTGRVALNRDWLKRWNEIFDIAFNQAQYGV